ncbi:hypothetical protein LTR95_007524 [Oleoguttula sp. CCFEE 5521]
METNAGQDRSAQLTWTTLAASLTRSATAITARATRFYGEHKEPDAATLLMATSAANLAAAAVSSLDAASRQRTCPSLDCEHHERVKKHCHEEIVTPYERYKETCKPAQEVFAIAELTEEILTYGFTMKQLFQLKRVNRFVENTIESSKQAEEGHVSAQAVRSQ